MQEFRHRRCEKMTTKVAIIQMRCAPQPDKNLAAALRHIAAAAKRGAQVVCLPELFRSRYFCQTEDHALFQLAEPIPGATTAALGAAAKEHGIILIGSIFERRSAGVYHNTNVLFDDTGKLIGKYRKMHIPDDPLYYEKFYFTPGDLGFQTFPTKRGNIGTLVCWDQWYPEGARLTALKGAQILFYPTAIGWHQTEKKKFGKKQYDAWVTIQRSHAIANGCFVAAPNRIGVEGTVQFWGGSFICDPFGEIITRASHDKEEILLADCDFNQVEITRQHWPFLRDRRIDAYAGITQRFLDA
ncbi:MAG: N-carbamoyl-D-amino acid hydrolase [Verrucomicrobiae bacterium]|nr:N-carbamoyl-D-amino acid hydrolase [Verrucomicrobiae bacterium]